MSEQGGGDRGANSDGRGPSTAGAPDWYEILDVEQGASAAEIEAAYKRALRIIDGQNLGGYLMLDPESRDAARQEVERAYAVLGDANARARFDQARQGDSAPREQGEPELSDRESTAAKGRRARRRRKREAARRARAGRQPNDTDVSRLADAVTIPVRPASEVSRVDDDGDDEREDDDEHDDEHDVDDDDQRITLITSAEAEPILEDDPLELPPAAAKIDAKPVAKDVSTAESKPAARDPQTPPPLPIRPKKPALRFLSPVVVQPPERPAAATSAASPTPRAITAPPVTTPPVTTPPVTTPPVTTPPAATEPPVSRRPWLYSDAGSDGVVTEPRVLSRSGTSDFDEVFPLASEGEINGGVIRRLREARGISLEELAEQTHISKSYLKAIEEQNVDDLPARVYLRGFLTQIARVLRVDKKQLAEGYISFVGRFGK